MKRRPIESSFRLASLIGFFTVAILCAPLEGKSPTIDCLASGALLDSQQNKLADLLRSQEELTIQFKEYIEKDLEDQVDDIFTEIHRNAAKKVVFAQKKLALSISTEREQIEKLKASYCANCAVAPSLELTHLDFCRRCPELSLCTLKPPSSAGPSP